MTLSSPCSNDSQLPPFHPGLPGCLNHLTPRITLVLPILTNKNLRCINFTSQHIPQLFCDFPFPNTILVSRCPFTDGLTKKKWVTLPSIRTTTSRPHMIPRNSIVCGAMIPTTDRAKSLTTFRWTCTSTSSVFPSSASVPSGTIRTYEIF